MSSGSRRAPTDARPSCGQKTGSARPGWLKMIAPAPAHQQKRTVVSLEPPASAVISNHLAVGWASWTAGCGARPANRTSYGTPSRSGCRSLAVPGRRLGPLDVYAYQAHTVSMAAKDSRLAVRLSSHQDALIRHAAEVEGTSITEFTVAAAMSHAMDVLADRRVFAIDDAAWREFLAVLDRPVSHKPRLEKLLAEPSVFTEA